MKKILTLLIVLSTLSNLNAQDQKLLDFQSANIAYEKYNDCPEAEKLLEPIKDYYKDNMSFLLLYAKVLKCQNKYKEALTVLQTYNAVAKDPKIDEEIAELNYKLRKEQTAKQTKENEIASELKANNLNGDWIVLSSNGNDYAVSSMIIQQNGNYISLKSSYYDEYGSATLLTEDSDYIEFRGSYTSKYTYTHKYQDAFQIMYGAGAYNTETLKTEYTWNNIDYKYNKNDKTLSFSIPKANIDNDGYVSNSYGEWFLTIKRKP